MYFFKDMVEHFVLLVQQPAMLVPFDIVFHNIKNQWTLNTTSIPFMYCYDSSRKERGRNYGVKGTMAWDSFCKIFFFPVDFEYLKENS